MSQHMLQYLAVHVGALWYRTNRLYSVFVAQRLHQKRDYAEFARRNNIIQLPANLEMPRLALLYEFPYSLC